MGVLSRSSVIRQIRVDDDGTVIVIRARQILDGLEVVAETLDRRVIKPGEPFNTEHARVRAIVQAARSAPGAGGAG